MKRLVVGVFVSSLTLFGLAPAASAASASESASVVTVTKAKAVKTTKAKAKAKKVKTARIIDWDAPSKSSGSTYSTQRIDWD